MQIKIRAHLGGRRHHQGNGRCGEGCEASQLERNDKGDSFDNQRVGGIWSNSSQPFHQASSSQAVDTTTIAATDQAAPVCASARRLNRSCALETALGWLRCWPLRERRDIERNCSVCDDEIQPWFFQRPLFVDLLAHELSDSSRGRVLRVHRVEITRGCRRLATAT